MMEILTISGKEFIHRMFSNAPKRKKRMISHEFAFFVGAWDRETLGRTIKTKKEKKNESKDVDHKHKK